MMTIKVPRFWHHLTLTFDLDSYFCISSILLVASRKQHAWFVPPRTHMD